jgi:signal transduction histidine kinase/DNA-binding response OmpR family regulator
MKFIHLTLVFILSFSSFSQKIVLNDDFKSPNICRQTAIFEDTTGALTFPEIRSKNFVTYPKRMYFFPFSNSTFWVKFKLENQSKFQKDWILLWDNAMVENLYFYIPQPNGTFRVIKEGCLVYKPKNKFAENTVTIPFKTFDNKEHVFYVKVQSQRGHQASFEVHSTAQLHEYNLSKFRTEGFMNGLFILRIIYVVLIAFFVVRDRTFRQYSGLTVARTMAYWGLLGILGSTFTSNPTLAMHINQQVYYTMPIWFSIILYSFLEVNRLPKFLIIILKIIPYLTIFICVNIIIFYKWYWLKAATILFVFTVFFVVILHIISIVKKYKIEWFYSTPFLLGICSNVYIPARLLGMQDFPGSGLFSLFLFVTEIILFGLFLGRIIRKYEKNRIETNNELLFNKEQSFKLQTLDLAKNNFFTNISHEFRTPLTLILAPVEDLRKKNPKDEVLEIIHRNANRLLELINQLLDISKLEAGQLKPEIREMELTSFFRRLASSFASLAESKNIKFEVTQGIEEVRGYIDTDKVEKIVNNLLSNAFKFTESGKKVLIEMEYLHKSSVVRIKVKDEGIGIPKDKIGNIFDRFYQIDENMNRKFDGTGIGLALVKELVEVLKGKINVWSTDGIGTSFLVELPIDFDTWKNDVIETVEKNYKENESEKYLLKAVKIDAEINENSQNEKIQNENILLIVDDNADIRAYIKSVFQQDYQIIEAINGKDGLLKATDITPNLIISDLMMPEMDGFEFCKQIKTDEKTSHIPVIMLTAKANIESKIEGLELGADDYLIKPFNATEIKIRVKNLLDKQEKLRQYFAGKTFELKPNEVKVNSLEETFLNNIKTIMLKYLSESTFNVEQFSQEMNMSSSQLLRKMKALTNMTPNEFIRNFRLTRAADLLSKKTGTISEIAFEVGFENLSYFSKVFQEKYGQLPSEYK